MGFKFLYLSALVGVYLIASWYSTVHGQIIPQLKNHVAITENTHTCGSINTKDIAALKSAGFQHIISLNTDDLKVIQKERETVESLGMEFIHIPVSWEDPSIESLRQFFEQMESQENSRLLVHCELNWRVSVFMYLYRTLILKEEESLARKDVLQVWNPWKDQTWMAFINQANHIFKE